MGTKNTEKTRMIAVTAIMSALSAVLMFVEISIPIMPSFIKFDLSDLPELITAFAYGPLFGVLVCLIKNVIHIAATQSAGIGELSNFILGAVFVAVAGLFYKIRRNRKSALVGSAVGSFSMAVSALPLNLFVIYPLYFNVMPKEVILSAYQDILSSIDSLWKAILVFNVPFTFIKGLIIVAIAFVIYPKLSPILKGGKSKQ